MQLTQRVRTMRVAAPIAVAGILAASLAACNSGSKPASTVVPHGNQAAATHKPAPKVCPLTGQVRHKGQSIHRAPLAVKIDNIAPALPQSGVNQADVVVEELVEGGLTRIMAIFQCNRAASVGPIRSARISDADILALLHGSVLGFSGANPRDLPPIQADSDAVLISQDSDPAPFHRDYSRAAPHNVFSSTHLMLKAGLARRPHLHAPKPLFSYGALSPAAKPAHTVSLHWPAASAVWTWSRHGWLRVQDGSRDLGTDGSQLSASNVVIMSVRIASTGLHDVLGNPSPLDVTTGSNPVWVLRDGKVVKGTWHRAGIHANLRLTDRHGKTIRLSPGRTWVELLPSPGKPTF